MSYMDDLLKELRTTWGIQNDGALAFIRAELVKSFKNGIMRGREERRGHAGERADKPRARR